MDQVTKPKINAKDFFLHIGAIAALYVFAISFISFLFDVINRALPDRQASYGDIYSTSLRLELSTIIVAFPLLLILLRFIYRDLLNDPVKRNLGLRKWLIYLTLFITVATMAIDVIVLLNTFLGGEITARFLWKVLTVLVVPGGIFWATLNDLRGTYFEKPKARNVVVWGSALVVLLSIIWGFMVMGSPSSMRDIRDDEQRVSDLQGIQWQIVSFYQTKAQLPSNLSDLNDPLSGYTVPNDPATGVDYGYNIVSSSTPLTFQLCADFAKPSQDTQGQGVYPSSYPIGTDVGLGGGDTNWKHDVGQGCFTRTIDPTKYPVTK